MDFSFDIQGNLKPYEKILISFEDFERNFVSAFEENSSRYQLFQNHKQFLESFRTQITPNFVHWINGSFVTNKLNPKDIDIFCLIDYSVLEEKEDLLRAEFIGDQLRRSYNIDAYLVILYPENHNLHRFTLSDKYYWNDWFTKSKMNRRRQRFAKGYLEIVFN